ncbi:MAG: NifB/NifX family molybdenum-iron cluster-binding protein [Desulfotomaculales bacterium]
MKLVVSAAGTGPDAQVDPRFGRCSHFVVYDTDTGTYEAMPNAAAAAAGGSGIQAAQAVVNAGAKAVLTGNIGPNAFRVLEAAGVKCYTGAGGTVKDAVAAYQAGKLTLAGAATAMPHAGMGRGAGRGRGMGGRGW